MGNALVTRAAEAGGPVVPSCVTEDSTSLCARVYGAFGTDWLAADADALIEKPATVALAAVVRGMLHRAIRRLTDRTASGAMTTALRPWRNRARQADREGIEQIVQRRTQRAEAIGSALRSFASIVVLGIAVVLVLGELGIGLALIIAGAGVIGVVWSVRNGEVLRVGNRSQGYAQVLIDMPVAHDTDLDLCRRLMPEVADTMAADAEWAPVLLAEPESLGVEQITAEGVMMRVQVPTTDADQWRVDGQLRMRLEERLVAPGIRTPLPLLGAGAGAGVGPR